MLTCEKKAQHHLFSLFIMLWIFQPALVLQTQLTVITGWEGGEGSYPWLVRMSVRKGNGVRHFGLFLSASIITYDKLKVSN